MYREAAIFLDRDGTITKEHGFYTYKLEDMEFIPRSIDAIRILNSLNCKIIVVTNQAGVAKGYYSEQDVILFNQLMKEELESQNAKIDAIFYCPHDDLDNCDCRKPKAGMLLRAAKDFNINLKKSWMIGDKISDILAGKTAECETVLILTGHGQEEIKNYHNSSDYITNDLYDAAKLLSKIRIIK